MFKFIDLPINPKTRYAHTSEFCRISKVPASVTPLGPNWKFESVFLPIKYKEISEDIEQFQVFPDDTYVVTFPKCGTTWAQSFVWLIGNNLDYALEKQNRLINRFPFFEYQCVFGVNDSTIDHIRNSIEITKNMKRPRFIKSHLPIALLPNQMWTIRPKIVYIARNPKDAVVSFYHHYVNIHGYEESLETFCDNFINDEVIYGPFFSHILDFWKIHNESNILFLTYEEMQSDIMNVLKRTSQFFDKTYTDEQLQDLANHISFGTMRQNCSEIVETEVNQLREMLGVTKKDENYGFIRKGKSGSFLEEMSPELIKRFDDWTEKNLKDSDFKFAM